MIFASFSNVCFTVWHIDHERLAHYISVVLNLLFLLRAACFLASLSIFSKAALQ